VNVERNDAPVDVIKRDDESIAWRSRRDEHDRGTAESGSIRTRESRVKPLAVSTDRRDRDEIDLSPAACPPCRSARSPRLIKTYIAILSWQFSLQRGLNCRDLTSRRRLSHIRKSRPIDNRTTWAFVVSISRRFLGRPAIDRQFDRGESDDASGDKISRVFQARERLGRVPMRSTLTDMVSEIDSRVYDYS
jgi:hypothetical protein